MTDSCYSDGEPAAQREEDQRERNPGLRPRNLVLTTRYLADSGPGGAQKDRGQKPVSQRPAGMTAS